MGVDKLPWLEAVASEREVQRWHWSRERSTHQCEKLAGRNSYAKYEQERKLGTKMPSLRGMSRNSRNFQGQRWTNPNENRSMEEGKGAEGAATELRPQ